MIARPFVLREAADCREVTAADPPPRSVLLLLAGCNLLNRRAGGSVSPRFVVVSLALMRGGMRVVDAVPMIKRRVFDGIMRVRGES